MILVVTYISSDPSPHLPDVGSKKNAYPTGPWGGPAVV